MFRYDFQSTACRQGQVVAVRGMSCSPSRRGGEEPRSSTGIGRHGHAPGPRLHGPVVCSPKYGATGPPSSLRSTRRMRAWRRLFDNGSRPTVFRSALGRSIACKTSDLALSRRGAPLTSAQVLSSGSEVSCLFPVDHDTDRLRQRMPARRRLRHFHGGEWTTTGVSSRF